MVRGSCSVCSISMRSADGSTEKARPTSRSVKNRNPHHHKKEWQFMPWDDEPEEYRYWHDHIPQSERPFG